MEPAIVIWDPQRKLWLLSIPLVHTQYQIVIHTIIAQFDSMDRAREIAALINKREPDVPE